MKALTVCQPYADALMGPKRIENRKQRRNHRGPLLIHAGKSHRWMETLTAAELATWPEYDPSKLKFGYIIGKVDVVACEPFDRAKHPSPWASGRYCLITVNPRRLVKPIPYLGALGMFDVPDELLAGAEWIPATNGDQP
jgi:hypothetical protein